MTPSVEADDDIEGACRELDGMDVRQAKLHQMGEPVIACSRLGLRMADDGDIHPEDAAPQLSRQIARGTASATADVQHRRSCRDASSPGESQNLVRRQKTFLPDVCVTVGQGCRGQTASPE